MTPRPPLVDPLPESLNDLAPEASRFRMVKLGVMSELYARLRRATRVDALDRVFSRTVEMKASQTTQRGSILHHGLALEDSVFHALWRRR